MGINERALYLLLGGVIGALLLWGLKGQLCGLVTRTEEGDMGRAIVVVMALLVTGCAGPISNSPGAKLSRLGEAVNFDEGLREAKFNLENGVAIGVLPADDPALPCVTGVMKTLGIDQPENGAVKSFDPKTDELLGRATVLYIRARQAQALAGQGINVSPGCEQLIGKILIDAGRGGLRAQPGGGLLPALR